MVLFSIKIDLLYTLHTHLNLFILVSHYLRKKMLINVIVYVYMFIVYSLLSTRVALLLLFHFKTLMRCATFKHRNCPANILRIN